MGVSRHAGFEDPLGIRQAHLDAKDELGALVGCLDVLGRELRHRRNEGHRALENAVAAVNADIHALTESDVRQGRFVDQLYELSLELDQKQGSEDITTTELRLKRQVDAAKRQISQLRRSYREGRISREEAEKRSYQIARPLVEEGR